MTLLSEQQIADVKERVDLSALAQDLGAKLRRSGGRFLGSCPICGGGARSNRFEVKGESWVCAVCSDGGDAIRLVRQVLGLDFAGAIERLGGSRVMTSSESEQLARRRREREAQERADADRYRRREFEACLRIWNAGRPPAALVVAYWQARGLLLPASALLREAEAVAYFHGKAEDEQGRSQPRVLARTPAQLALLLDNDEQPAGLHITHLAPGGAGKAEIVDPDTGEVLPAKKMRGSKKGCHIRVRQPPREALAWAARSGRRVRLFMGEGIETVGAVATDLQRRSRFDPLDIFWAAGDLGNLGGPHRETVAHPTLKGPSGRPQRVPGPDPDTSGPAIAIPDYVTDLVLLGDGDSEPFLTQQTLERGRRRYGRAGRRVAVAMAPQGRDFNDLIERAG